MCVCGGLYSSLHEERTGAGRGPAGALCVSSWLSQFLSLGLHPVPLLLNFNLLALCFSVSLSCDPLAFTASLWMGCAVPQKHLSFYINSLGSWNDWFPHEHLSCSHVETGERWHQPQHSEGEGLIDKGIESSGMAQGLQTFHHSTAWGTALLCKDQAFVTCLEQFIKEPATELFSFHSSAQCHGQSFIAPYRFSIRS